jgi:hypothetical protein
MRGRSSADTALCTSVPPRAPRRARPSPGDDPNPGTSSAAYSP